MRNMDTMNTFTETIWGYRFGMGGNLRPRQSAVRAGLRCFVSGLRGVSSNTVPLTSFPRRRESVTATASLESMG